ncbi:MAG TPA: hypothetical protein VG206_00370 [Terriglobia bacterium]|nr:hypothetical protein [Terriglobia bacterium]
MGATPEAAASWVETGLRKTLVNGISVFGGETIPRLCGWLKAEIPVLLGNQS